MLNQPNQNTNIDLSDLGFKSHDNNDLSDLGFKPHEDLQASKIAKKSGSFLSGLGTSLINQAIGTVELPEQVTRLAATGLNRAIKAGTGIDFGEPGLKTTALQEVEEPENPNISYKAGHFTGEALPWVIPGVESVKLGVKGLQAGGKIAGLITDKLMGQLGANPNAVSNDILKTIGGDSSLEENAKELAENVASNFDTAKKNAGSIYDSFLKAKSPDGNGKVGDIDMSKNIDKYLDIASQPKVINDKDLVSNYSPDTKGAHNQFVNDPTINNAHNLLKTLGAEIRSFKGNISNLDRNTLQMYSKARNALKSDFEDALDSVHPELKNIYQSANADYVKNVVPYLENPKVSKIARGDVTNPRNIIDIFRNPEPETEKVVSDLGNDASNKIIYSELGKLGENPNPQQLLNSFNSLDKKGLESYVTPEIQSKFNLLNKTIQTKKSIMKYAKYGALGLGMLEGKNLFHYVTND